MHGERDNRWRSTEEVTVSQPEVTFNKESVKMKFQLKPFKDLIALSKEKIDEALAPLRASTAKAKATLKSAEIDEKIAALGQRVQEMCSSKDIDFDAIADKIDEIELLELRQSRFTDLVAQLFPTE
jgi:hypothetical protein